jgi:hypothetical protein
LSAAEGHRRAGISGKLVGMCASRALALVCIVLVACEPTVIGDRSDAGASRDAGALDARGASDSGTEDDAGTSDDAGVEDAFVDPGADAFSPPARACSFRSSSYAGAPLELDVGPTSPERLRFTVSGLPDPALVASATLRFSIFDADHPGEEGVIRVNGGAPLDIPAMLAWDNVESVVTVDVSGQTIAGDNTIEFGPGPLDRSFFRVSLVSLELSARVSECLPSGPPPDPTAVRRELHFHEAVYTNRATWVVPCPPGHPRWAAIRDYAFTASGAEHESTDCDGLYRAGSGERGTATFTFPDVIPSTYGVYVRFRSSANRNPRGALFVVNGEEMRIDQVDASGDYFEVLFGDRRLGGTVTVVLDSSREAESDSVTWVRLEPR